MKRPAHRAQHAEAEHIHFQQPQRIEIVLVPLDHRAIGHRGVLDGHEFIQTPARDDEAAHMLREMAGKAQYLRGERDEARNHGILGIETGGTDAVRVDALAIPPLHAARELVDLRKIEPQRLADVPQGAARTIANDGGRQGRALAAVLAVDILNHLFAPLVLEIHVDVRRLVALF